MKFCRNCGSQLKDSAKFCPVCGAPADPSEAPQPVSQNELFCPVCSAPVPENAKFCKNCGAKLSSGAAAPQQLVNMTADFISRQAQARQSAGQAAPPAAKPRSKRWILPTVLGVLLAAGLAVGGFFLFRDKGDSPKGDKTPALESVSGADPEDREEEEPVVLAKTEIKEGVLQMDDVSVDFGDNEAADGKVILTKETATETQKERGVVGDLYHIRLDQTYDEPVSMTLPLPEEYTGAEDQVLRALFFVDVENSDGSVTQEDFFLEPEIGEAAMELTFIPSEVTQPAFRTGRDTDPTEEEVIHPGPSEEKAHPGLDVKVATFCTSAVLTSGEGHFKILVPNDEAVNMTDDNDPIYKKYERVLNLLEDAYAYYYNDLGYECRKDDLYPLEIRIVSTGKANGYFVSPKFPFGSPWMELDKAADPYSEDSRVTIYHETFHAVQYGYGYGLKRSTFFEATAAYYEAKVAGGSCSGLFNEEKSYSFDGLFGDYWWNPLGKNLDFINGGYGREGLIYYISNVVEKGSDEWIKTVLSNGGKAKNIQELEGTSWAEDYYLALVKGEIPCIPNRDSSETLFHATDLLDVLKYNATHDVDTAGVAVSLELPSEKELKAWREENEKLPEGEQAEPLELGSLSVDVDGKAAQVLLVPFDLEQAQKYPDNINISVELSNPHFNYHIIRILRNKEVTEAGNLNELADKEVSKQKAKNLYFEILLFNSDVLDKSGSTEVRFLMTEQDICGEYQVSLTEKYNYPDGSSAEESKEGVIILGRNPDASGSQSLYINKAPYLKYSHGQTPGIPAVIVGDTIQLVLEDYKVKEIPEGYGDGSYIQHTYNGILNLTLDHKVLYSTITDNYMVYEYDEPAIGMKITYSVYGAG